MTLAYICILQAKSNTKAAAKQYFCSKAYHRFLSSASTSPLLAELDKLQAESGCFTNSETCLSSKYAVMLDFEDLGEKLPSNLFFQGVGMVLNLDFWSIENISGMFA
jgi:hypothetical protein